MQDRRHAVPFDPEYFARRAAAGARVSAEDAFRHAYATNHWAGAESASGPGASLEQTAVLRRELPRLCARLKVRTLLDLPCGDCAWMSATEPGVERYIGADLLPELVESNARWHARSDREFRVLDLLTSRLPRVDLVLCRDCLVHFSFADITRAVHGLQASGSTWLLATTFPEERSNVDICTGDWRPINLEASPFHWPAPEQLINERCTESGGVFADKSLGLWRVDVLPRA